MRSLQFAQKAVVTRDNAILLVRKAETDPHNPGLWELPGGRLEDPESLDDQICREVLEETGLEIVPGNPIHIWDWTMSRDDRDIRVVAISRYCELSPSKAQEPQRTSDDHLAEQKWFTLRELVDVEVIPSQKHTINVAASHLEETSPCPGSS